jgi:hypothetical protein
MIRLAKISILISLGVPSFLHRTLLGKINIKWFRPNDLWIIFLPIFSESDPLCHYTENLSLLVNR